MLLILASYYTLGWSKTPFSSQTDKLMAATKFSDYLGLKHYKKAKKIKHFIHLNFAYWPQSLSTYHSISTYREFKPSSKCFTSLEHTFLDDGLNSL